MRTDAQQTLLLVEDSDLLRPAVVRMLRKEGYDVTAVATASAALSLVRPFDIGVFDVELVDGDGVTLARELEIACPLGRIVFFTTSLNAELVTRATRFGEVVPKDRGELLRVLRKGR